MRVTHDYPRSETPDLVLGCDARPNGLHGTFALLPRQHKWWAETTIQTHLHWCCSHQRGRFRTTGPLIVLANSFEFHGPCMVMLTNEGSLKLLRQWRQGLNGPRSNDPFDLHDAYDTIKEGALDEIEFVSAGPPDAYFRRITTCALEHLASEGPDGMATLGIYLRRIMAP